MIRCRVRLPSRSILLPNSKRKEVIKGGGLFSPSLIPMKFLIAVTFGWYLILRIAEGGMTVGPYASESLCMKVVEAMTERLKDSAIVITVARCEWRQEI